METASSTSTKRILVTGGAGFLGSHLVDRLVAQGHRVTVVDSLLSGNLDNIAKHIENERINFHQHDVTFPFDAAADEIYNLACPASPPLYQVDPIHTARTCALGAMNVLSIAERHGARVLQASTSEIYGDPQVHPQPEGYWGNVNPIGIRSCYDEGKRFAETLFMDHWRHRGVDARIVRIFNTYGPRMSPDDGRVISNFIVQALTGAPITLNGDGTQTRSFCYVDDLIDGFLKMMAAPRGTIGPFNMGNPVEFSMEELAELVIDLTGSSSEIIYQPLPSDDPRQRKPDISQATAELGWKPATELRKGLIKTIAHFEAVLRTAGRLPEVERRALAA